MKEILYVAVVGAEPQGPCPGGHCIALGVNRDTATISLETTGSRHPKYQCRGGPRLHLLQPCRVLASSRCLILVSLVCAMRQELSGINEQTSATGILLERIRVFLAILITTIK